jgi:spermidine synthase
MKCPFATFWLLVTAAVCGAVVMALELLGARLLGVVYGGSLAVWAAIIAVTLLSLAVGYFLGGWLADRAPRPALLYALPLSAAVLIAVCPYARFILTACHGALGIQGGALAGSAVLFSLPLGLLGGVSPFIIKLLCSGGQRVGFRAGGVYAVSTLGSVAGTLLTGLWLIPTFGTNAGFRMTAAAAAVVGVTGLVAARRWKGAPFAILPVILASIPSAADRAGRIYTAPDGERVEIKAVRDSAYGQIAILDKGHYRLLVVNGIIQTGIPRDVTRRVKGQCLQEGYYQELLAYTVDDPSACSGLLIGLAGGMTASMLALYDVDLDCVEIDPAIVEVARTHFGFAGRAIVADGRQVLEGARRRYDFCVIDTYSGDVFPFHLATRECFEAARGVLKPGGVLAVNYIGAPAGRAFACLYRTLGAVFRHVLAIRGEPGDDVQTITVFASDRDIRFNRGWLDTLGGFTGVDPISQAIQRLTVRPARADAFILTDDYNPIDVLRSGEALRWRQRTARNIGEPGLF